MATKSLADSPGAAPVNTKNQKASRLQWRAVGCPGNFGSFGVKPGERWDWEVGGDGRWEVGRSEVGGGWQYRTDRHVPET